MTTKKELMDKARILKKKCVCNKPISKYNKAQLEQYINNKKKSMNKKSMNKKSMNKKSMNKQPTNKQSCEDQENFLIQDLAMSRFEKYSPGERRDSYARGRAFVKVVNLPKNQRPDKYKMCDDSKKRTIENKLNIIEKKYGKELTKNRNK